MLDAVDLPDDIAALKAMLIASQLREVRKDDRIEWLEKLVAAFKQAAFGRKSEKVDPEQFDLALEDLETAIAAIHAEDEADSAPGKPQAKPRAANRGSLPAHLPRVEEIIEPESLICNCGGGLHCIGEDMSERLDIIPAQFRGWSFGYRCRAIGRHNRSWRADRSGLGRISARRKRAFVRRRQHRSEKRRGYEQFLSEQPIDK